MTTYLLPPEPITTLDAWLATDAGQPGVPARAFVSRLPSLSVRRRPPFMP